MLRRLVRRPVSSTHGDHVNETGEERTRRGSTVEIDEDNEKIV